MNNDRVLRRLGRLLKPYEIRFTTLERSFIKEAANVLSMMGTVKIRNEID